MTKKADFLNGNGLLYGVPALAYAALIAFAETTSGSSFVAKCFQIVG